MGKNPVLVSATASVLHIVDEISWELVPETAGRKIAISVMKGLPAVLGIDDNIPFNELTDEKDSVIDNWVRVTAWMAKNCEHTGLCEQEKD
jgi:adenosylcobinamide hydrolase